MALQLNKLISTPYRQRDRKIDVLTAAFFVLNTLALVANFIRFSLIDVKKVFDTGYYQATLRERVGLWVFIIQSWVTFAVMAHTAFLLQRIPKVQNGGIKQRTLHFLLGFYFCYSVASTVYYLWALGLFDVPVLSVVFSMMDAAQILTFIATVSMFHVLQ